MIHSEAGNEIAQTNRFEAPEPGLQPVDECEHLVPDQVQIADDEQVVTEGGTRTSIIGPRTEPNARVCVARLSQEIDRAC